MVISMLELDTFVILHIAVGDKSALTQSKVYSEILIVVSVWISLDNTILSPIDIIYNLNGITNVD